MIKDGYIMVNGLVVLDSLYFVSDDDVVTFSEQIGTYASQLGVILFNKPRGVWTNCKIGNDEEEVKDLLPKKYAAYSSIGRLDKDSEGLILFTNDGVFANQFLNSDDVHERRYKVWTKRELSAQNLRQLRKGVILDDGLTLPATVTVIDRNCYEFILIEGKNRQIRRMIEACGTHTIRLQRIQFGPYVLGSIRSGMYDFQSLRDQFLLRLK